MIYLRAGNNFFKTNFTHSRVNTCQYPPPTFINLKEETPISDVRLIQDIGTSATLKPLKRGRRPVSALKSLVELIPFFPKYRDVLILDY